MEFNVGDVVTWVVKGRLGTRILHGIVTNVGNGGLARPDRSAIYRMAMDGVLPKSAMTFENRGGNHHRKGPWVSILRFSYTEDGPVFDAHSPRLSTVAKTGMTVDEALELVREEFRNTQED